MKDITDASKGKEENVTDSVEEIKKKLDIIEAGIEKIDKNLNGFKLLCGKYFKNFPKAVLENKPGIPRS